MPRIKDRTPAFYLKRKKGFIEYIFNKNFKKGIGPI
jgi:hypothetical protein